MSESDTTQAPEATDTTAEDEQASTALAEAEQAGGDEPEDGLDPRVKAKIEKANREAANLRKRLKELEPLAKAHQDSQNAQKSEVQRLSDQLGAAEVELAQLRVEKVRTQAATAAGLDPELAEFITAVEPDDAAAQAKRLAKRLTPPEPARADFRQGARTQPAATRDNNALLRGMAGYPE